MSHNIRRAKNYIRECDLPRKANEAQESLESHDERQDGGNRAEKSDGKPTASDLEEAQLLIGAAGSIGEEQIVFMMEGSEHANQDENETDGGNDIVQPEISEEDLRKELQELLDSQLNQEEEGMDSASRHLMGRREQVFECEDEIIREESEPSKGFTASEIQAFMNNQIRKQHQQHVLGEQFDKAPNRSHQPQQHLILVTQNGDKIILIQNPNEMEREESEHSDFHPNFDITDDEEKQIQLKHKARQQMFLVMLEKLRQQHKERLPANVTTPAVPHLLPIKLVPYPKAKTETPLQITGVDLPDPLPETNSCSKPRAKSTKVSRKRGSGPPKWLKPVNVYLNMAIKYMKRREDKVDEIAKMFPSASTSFTQKCQNMKQELMNIELIIERFQNTIGNDLEEVSAKFKSFLGEFDLSNCLDEVEAGDEVDEFDSNMFEAEEPAEPKAKHKKVSRKTLVSTDIASASLQLITPSNISITSTISESVPSSAPHPDLNCESDPFDFTQDPESMIDIKPITPNISAIKTGLVSKQDLQNSNHDRPVRSARLQNKRLTKEPPILPPTKPKRVVRR